MSFYVDYQDGASFNLGFSSAALIHTEIKPAEKDCTKCETHHMKSFGPV